MFYVTDLPGKFPNEPYENLRSSVMLLFLFSRVAYTNERVRNDFQNHSIFTYNADTNICYKNLSYIFVFTWMKLLRTCSKVTANT